MPSSPMPKAPNPAAAPTAAPDSVLKGNTMQKIIFACVHNAGRSQMAAAFFNRLADPAKAEALSAGTEPRLRVHPKFSR
jgi:hypothetical protein